MTSTHPLRVVLLMGHAGGGIAAHVASLARGLTDSGVETVLATSGTSADALAPSTPGVQRLWPGSGDLRRLRRLLRGADVVHAHGHQAGALAVALLAPRRRGRPTLVVTWHNALLAGGWRRLVGSALEHLQVRGADLVTGASGDLVRCARGLGARAAELSEVAPADLTPWQGSRRDLRARLSRELGLPLEADWVLTVSRIAPQKNLPVLVEAAHRLARRDVVWLVAGSGDPDLTTRLQRQIRELDAPVRLLGARTDVPELMAAASVLAVPSRWEARAFVVQEAMVAGLPCVVTDTGGLPELVGDAGLVVAVDDPDALGAAVGAVLDDPALAATLAQRSRTTASGFLTSEAVVRQWLARYHRLTS